MSDSITYPAAPTLVTWAQRCTLLDVLERETERREAHATQLDEALVAEVARVQCADDVEDYDEKAGAVDAAHEAADVVDTLRWMFDEAKVITTQPPAETDPVATIARCLIAAHAAGSDVGEVLVLAVAEAQRTVHQSTEACLTSNRPGSWEADHLDNIIESSGWAIDLP